MRLRAKALILAATRLSSAVAPRLSTHLKQICTLHFC